MTELGLLEVDLGSGEGGCLLAAVADRHPALARAAGILHRVFLVRSPWAPGLRFVGAQAGGFSLAGGGLTVEDALTSCLGEAVERLSQVERPGDLATTGSLPAVDGRVMPAAVHLLQQLAAPGDAALDWVAARGLGGGGCLVPADWCLRRATDGPARIPGTALSTGCAAGPTAEAAAARALLELVERDAAALWWLGGRRARPLPLDPGTAALLHTLRDGGDERRTVLLDITTDLGVPAVAAVSTGRDGGGFTAGLAARSSPGDAAHAALIELCQMEVGLQLSMLKRRRLGEAALGADDRRHIARAAGIAADDPRLQPAGPSCDHAPVGDSDDLVQAAQAFRQTGIEAALVELTRPDMAVAVVKAVAPALQPLPGEVRSDRLRRAAAEGDPRASVVIPLV